MPNTLTLRVNAKTREAAMEGLDFVVLGDTVRIQLTEALGVGLTGSGLEVAVFTKAANATNVIYKAGFTAVPRQPGSFFTDVRMESPKLATALAAALPGSDVPLRLYVRDTESDFTYVDMDLPFRDNPLYDNTSLPATGNPYVTQSQLANLLAQLDEQVLPDQLVSKSDILTLVSVVDALPLDTLAETNAALKSLLSGLIVIAS